MVRFQTPLLLILGMILLVGLASLIGSEQLNFTLTEMLIRKHLGVSLAGIEAQVIGVLGR